MMKKIFEVIKETTSHLYWVVTMGILAIFTLDFMIDLLKEHPNDETYNMLVQIIAIWLLVTIVLIAFKSTVYNMFNNKEKKEKIIKKCPNCGNNVGLAEHSLPQK